MDIPVKAFRQHLIDPELCLRCNACEETCSKQAIRHDYNNYAVDPALCDACMECVEQCPTGAVDHWHLVPVYAVYEVDTQLTWQELPLPELHESDSTPEPVHSMAPASAATPVINRFTKCAPAQASVYLNQRLTPDHCESDIHHLVLDFADTSCPVLEGQSLGVLAPGVDAQGHPHAMRVYSVASARDGENCQASRFALTVKRVTLDSDGKPARGVCSNYLSDLAIGAEVQVVGPYGNSFLMPDDPQARLLMVATGTGIAPMRGIVNRRLRTGTASPDRLKLFYGGRTPDEMPYLNDFERLDGVALTLHRTCSRLAGEPRRYVQDLIAEAAEVVASWLGEPNSYVYLCGLKGMEAGVMAALGQAVERSGGDWGALHQRLKTEHRLHIETY